MQLIVNSAFGFVVAVGLFFIGVPNPLVWGILATVLRFLPYIGSLDRCRDADRSGLGRF